MSRKASSSSSSHTHDASGRCEVCGSATEIERAYEIDDRLLQTLFMAVCRTMKLKPYRLPRRRSLFVMAPDLATHDELWQRFSPLATTLDQKLMALTADFIREQCGLDVGLPPTT